MSLDLEQDLRAKRLDACPDPMVRVPGPYIVVYRDAADEKYGKLFIPKNAQKPTSVGTIVMIGEGFTLDHEYDPQGFSDHVPFQEGDRVVFSKYAGDEIGCRVHPDWWKREENRKEVESMARLGQETLYSFVLLKPSQIHAVLEYPEREVWEE